MESGIQSRHLEKLPKNLVAESAGGTMRSSISFFDMEDRRIATNNHICREWQTAMHMRDRAAQPHQA